MPNKKLLISVLVILFAIVLIVLLIFVNPKQVSEIKPVSAEKLTIATDKIEYKQGETVKIIITSSSKYPVVQQTFSLSEAKYAKYLGDNYGIGLIEKFTDSEWAVIEPVWRCDNSCFAECKYDHSIGPGKSRVFEWQQTILNCDSQNRSEEIENAGTGRYRISSGFWNEQEQKNEVIYSNEFVIK
ncbi:hypothetical protein KAU19_03590 [Candidatus Parcubacteria bacterium]|nr:hypothetical protein [Candidatus Parcubacteria bacterium]